MDIKTTSIYLDKDLRKKIEEMAKKERRSVNQQILFLLAELLNEGGKK